LERSIYSATNKGDQVKKLIILSVLLAGCSAYTAKPTTTVLPTSNRSIDVVLHRSDVRVLDCATLAVIQTYDTTGKMIDSQQARGQALHCAVIPALIEAGGRVGAAAATRPAITTIKNAINQSQGFSASNANANTNTNTNTTGSYSEATGGSASSTSSAAGGAGGAGGAGNGGGSGGAGGQGNNGNGNGSSDGTNPGSDNHHDNGDNT